MLAKIDSLNRKVHLYQKQLSGPATCPSATQSESSVSPHVQPEVKSVSTTALVLAPSPQAVVPPSRQSTYSSKSQKMSPASSPQPPAGKLLPDAIQTVGNDQSGFPISRPGTPESAIPSIISRKRPLPDDFDIVVPMPAQPMVSSPQTNGLRRAINGLRSGFTPSRNPTPSPTKPKASGLGISDITNSPRFTSAPQMKVKGKSWLGKRKVEMEQ